MSGLVRAGIANREWPGRTQGQGLRLRQLRLVILSGAVAVVLGWVGVVWLSVSARTGSGFGILKHVVEAGMHASGSHTVSSGGLGTYLDVNGGTLLQMQVYGVLMKSEYVGS